MMRKQMNRLNKNESGYTLVGVLMVFIVLAVLGMSIMMLSMSSVKTSTKERNHQTAFYMAESGVNMVMKEIEEKVSEIFQANPDIEKDDFYREVETLLVGFPQKTYDENNFEKVRDQIPEARVTVEHLEETVNQYRIESEGKLGDETRTVITKFEVAWNEEAGSGELPPFAVFTKEEFTMSNGTVYGDIGTLNDEKYAISFPSGGPEHFDKDGTNHGSIFTPNGDIDNIYRPNNTKIIPDMEKLGDYKFPELPLFPDVPSNYQCPNDYTIVQDDWNRYKVIRDCGLYIDNHLANEFELILTDNLKIDEIKLAENNNLYINVGNFDREIVVDTLDLTNGNLIIKGNSSLTIYVKDRINFGTTVLNPDSDFHPMDSAYEPLPDRMDELLNKLNIYYIGDEDLKLTANAKVFGSFYSNSEEASLNLGGGAGIYGNIFMKGPNIKLDGGTGTNSQLVLAPHAHVNASGSGTFNGQVYSKTFNVIGDGKVIFDNSMNLDSNNPLSAQSVIEHNKTAQTVVKPPKTPARPIREKR